MQHLVLHSDLACCDHLSEQQFGESAALSRDFARGMLSAAKRMTESCLAADI